MEKTMNVYLANLVCFYHKLQSYHWCVQGTMFFQAHAKLEEYYDIINTQIDELAELILMDGKKPISTMKDFMELSTIKDGTGDFISDMVIVFSEVLADFDVMLESAKKIKLKADEADNSLVSAKMDSFIETYAKIIWMLKSVLV